MTFTIVELLIFWSKTIIYLSQAIHPSISSARISGTSASVRTGAWANNSEFSEIKQLPAHCETLIISVFRGGVSKKPSLQAASRRAACFYEMIVCRPSSVQATSTFLQPSYPIRFRGTLFTVPYKHPFGPYERYRPAGPYQPPRPPPGRQPHPLTRPAPFPPAGLPSREPPAAVPSPRTTLSLLQMCTCQR